MKTIASIAGAFLVAAVVSNAENWPRFRGPSGQGISEETGLPLHWSASENVAWKAPLPGEAWSSPIVWNDSVFVTTATEAETSCRVLRLDRQDGRILWNVEVFQQAPGRKERKNTYATPTPATDGQSVYAVFGDGSVAAVRFDGTIAWINRDVKFYSRHGLGASPIIHGGLLIMPYDGSNRVEKPAQYPNNPPEEKLGWQTPWDQAFIAALDLKTGQRVWTGQRGLSRIAHVTPNILNVEGQDQLISCAGDAIQGFDPATGKRIWTVYSQGEGVTPSFALGDGLVFTSSGFEKTTLRTIRAGGQGDVTETHIAWEQRKGCPTQPSLLYVSPYLYTITDGGIVNCYEGKTGEVVYQERVGGNHAASPVCADGKMYFLSERGETTIVEMGPNFKILARNALEEKCLASMAISQKQLFIRSESHLFCIGSER